MSAAERSGGGQLSAAGGPGRRAGHETRPYVGLPGQDGSEAGKVREAARARFDDFAALYDRARPGYPAGLFSDLESLAGLRGARLLEIGCGTGQATVELARRASSVLCVELGEALAALARRRLAAWPNVEIRTGAFEAADLPGRAFDLVFAATSFHWLDPAVAYEKSARLLADGGVLALVSNTHVHGGTQVDITDELAPLHERLCPEVGAWAFPPATRLLALAEAAGDIAHRWGRLTRRFADVPDVSGLFEEPIICSYDWTEHYDTTGFLEMLATQSGYLALGPARRAEILSAIGEVVDRRLGGQVSKAYLTLLALARRR